MFLHAFETGNRASHKAFTLIELLVVISIVALLISILLPALKSARGSANNMACLSRERQMGIAFTSYAQDYKGVLPAGDTSLNVNWTDFLAPYHGINEGDYSGYNSKRRQRMADLLRDADVQYKPGNSLYYSSHPRLMPDTSKIDYSDPARPNLKQQTIAMIRNPSKLIAIMDGTQVGGGGVSVVAKNLDRGACNGSIVADGKWYSSYLIHDFCAPAAQTSIDANFNMDAANWGDGFNLMNIRFRHLNNTSCNVVMLDGHAQTMRYRSQYDTDVLRENVNIDY